MLLTVALVACAALIVLIAGLSLLQWLLQGRRAAREARELSVLQRDHAARRLSREHAESPLLLETLTQDVFLLGATRRPHSTRKRLPHRHRLGRPDPLDQAIDRSN